MKPNEQIKDLSEIRIEDIELSPEVMEADAGKLVWFDRNEGQYMPVVRVVK